MRGKRYSEEKIRRQAEGKIKEKWSRTQNRTRREGWRGKETRERKTHNNRDVEMKAKTERRKNGPLEYQTRDPDEVYRTILRSEEAQGSKFALVKAESLYLQELVSQTVELYYAKRLEDIGVILRVVLCQITSCLSVSFRTLFQTL